MKSKTFNADRSAWVLLFFYAAGPYGGSDSLRRGSEVSAERSAIIGESFKKAHTKSIIEQGERYYVRH